MTHECERHDPATVRPAPHASVATAFLMPEAVLFDARHGDIHLLNPSASVVWLSLDGEQSIVEVAAELSEIFDVDESTMLSDVEAAVADFGRRGLLTSVDRPDSELQLDEPVSQRITTLARPPDP